MALWTCGFSAWLFVIAIATSALGGSLGMASGIFIVPVLVTFGGVGIRTAVAASIVSVIACSCGSAAAFLRAGLTNIRIAIVLKTATTLGALTGIFSGAFCPRPFCSCCSRSSCCCLPGRCWCGAASPRV